MPSLPSRQPLKVLGTPAPHPERDVPNLAKDTFQNLRQTDHTGMSGRYPAFKNRGLAILAFPLRHLSVLFFPRSAVVPTMANVTPPEKRFSVKRSIGRC